MKVDSMDTFDREYDRLSMLGACDAVFGMEHGRVKREWVAAGRPEDIEAFIRRRANVGPNGEDPPPMMKTYRCKHAVEAMHWTDTDADREAFSTWFESHDAVFETRGPIALLPDLQTRRDPDDSSTSVDTYDVKPGEWILFSDGEFIAMEDDLFWDTYEAIP